MTDTEDRRDPVQDPPELPDALPVPTEPELPEEGFVPFSQESKMGRKKKLLTIAAVLAVLGGAFLLTKKYIVFYARTLRHLQFDYRDGENADTAVVQEPGAAASAAENEIGGKTLSLSANVYCFNSQRELSLTVSAYDYTHAADCAALNVRKGKSNMILTQKNRFRVADTGQVLEIESDGEHISDDKEPALLYDFFFGTAPHNRVTLQCQEAYETTVSGQKYTCEIWLMSYPGKNNTVYDTLYRYYNDCGRLAAVRLLSSENDLMMVYDITDYKAE